MSLVVGLDTKSRGFHWVSNLPVEIVGVPQRCGWAETSPDAEAARAELFSQSRALFQVMMHQHGEVHVFCEEPLALQNGKTTRLLGLAAGAIQAGFFQAAHFRGWWYWVDVAGWKKSVLGRGAPPADYVGDTSRSRVKDWIRDQVDAMPAFSHWRTEAAVSHETMMAERDLYDAWCLKTYGVRELAKMGVPRILPPGDRPSDREWLEPSVPPPADQEEA